MEAAGSRNIKNGAGYAHLFPAAKGNIYTIRRNASLSDTMAFVPKVVAETLSQTKKFSRFIKRKTPYETCKNLWHFIYNHIAYRKDEQGYEQIRSPARAWHDRKSGVDCDCYAVFISSVLTNLGIPHLLRITKYKQDHFQHVYPVVPDGKRYITMDCVTDQFDFEVPYTAKKDYPMDLQFLDGLPLVTDFDVTGMDDGGDELGKLLLKNIGLKKIAQLPVKKPLVQRPASAATFPAGKQNIFQKLKAKAIEKIKSAPASSSPGVAPGTAVATDLPQPKKKKGLKKVLNKINKINPATVLLRNGILASMKLNVKKVASRLRWSYITPEQAAQKGIDPEKFKRLVATRQKLENIFYGAGGKTENLKKAILGGKGNKDKAVNGFGVLPAMESLEYMDTGTPLGRLLGPELYYSENVEGMEGFAGLSGLGELGEPLSLASVAAAAGVVAGIVGALKQIGDIFKSKSKGSADFEEESPASPEAATPKGVTQVDAPSPAATLPFPPNVSTRSENLVPEPGSDSTSSNSPASTNATQTEEDSDDIPAVPAKQTATQEQEDDGAASNKPAKNEQGFWDKNRTWLKPTAYVGGSIALIAIGYTLLKKKHKGKDKSGALSGLASRKKKNHYRKHKQNHKHKHKTAVALL